MANFRPLIAECVGTFCLVFAGTGAIVIDEVNAGSVTHVGIALTFGLVVMALIYALGDVSGAHFNPAVTVGFLLAGRMPVGRAAMYVLSQVVGGLLASVSLFLMFGDKTSLGVTAPFGSVGQSFALEVVLTWILMLVILRVSTGAKEMGIIAGIAVGGVITLEALFAGPISGASMNPARSLAPALVSGHMAGLWIYMLAPTLGAALAVPIWRVLRGQQTSHVEGKSSVL